MAYIRKTVIGLLVVAVSLAVFLSLVMRVANMKAQTIYAAGFVAVKAQNVVQNFEMITSQGVQGNAPSLDGFDMSEIKLNVNHIQGMGVYGEYVIITINGHYPDNDTGIIYIFDQNGIVQKLYTPRQKGKDMSHTGGMQVAGDYLYVVIQDNGQNTGAFLCVYHLAPLNKGEEVYLYHSCGIENFHSSMVGATTYRTEDGVEKILLCDSEFTFFVSDIPHNKEEKPSWSKCRMHPDSRKRGSGEDNNVAFITDTDNALWVIGMQNRNIGGGGLPNYGDTLYLYPLEINNDCYKLLPSVADKDMTPYDHEFGALGSHFRFASTVAVEGNGAFTVYATQSIPIGAILKGLTPYTLPINIYR